MRRGRLVLVVALAVAAVAAVAVVVAFASGSDGESELLPDLDVTAPGEISGRTVGTADDPRFFLGFESAAGNVGDGPLIVVGTRRNRQQREMTVVQHIESDGGARRTVPVKAELIYVHSFDHEHWHLLDFMRYELRRAGKLVAPDRKTGFCLGDRYEVGLPLGRAEPQPTFTQECGKGQQGLLRLQEGISVGYGDDYDAHLEGQSFDITGLAAGRYLLVHRVNPERALEELDYSNNVSSMSFELGWPSGKKNPPRITVIRRCPDAATCS